MNSVDILFVLLVTICVIALIIILCKKSKKSRNEVVGDAVIEITEKFNNNSDLGTAIDNVIQAAFNEVNDINDKEKDDFHDKNYNSNVYHGNEVDGYSSEGHYHDSDPASTGVISDHHNINDNYNYIPDKDHNYIHSKIKHHAKNIYEEDSGNNLGVKQTHFSPKKKKSYRNKTHSKHSKYIDGNPECLNCTELPNYKGDNKCECNNEVRCGECNDCTWCIDESLNGNCVENHNASEKNCVNLRPNYKPPDKSQQCTLGGESMPSAYANAGGGCNLYNNYKDCLSCAEEGHCGAFYANSRKVQCKKCDITGKTMNCLHQPGSGGSHPGFGCPGKNYTSDNIAPIDPTKNNNDVCEYSTH